MRMHLVPPLMVLTLMTVAGYATAQQRGTADTRGADAPRPASLHLTSPAFPDLGHLPLKYTQAEQALSPPLSWTNVPPNTAAFVLTLKDPEMAQNRNPEEGVVWMVMNIPGNVTSLPEGIPPGTTSMLPEGAMQNSYRTNGYIGPAARSPVPHHYTFELYALSAKLDVPPNATRAQVLQAMAGKVIGKAVLIGMCCRRPQ